MTQLSGDERKGYVRGMFGQIAGRYDLMNRLMALGQDVGWRKEAIRKLEISPGSPDASGMVAPLVLDAGAGTGDLALQLRKEHPHARVVASDLTPEMMRVGMQRPGAEAVLWVAADAENLPFAPGAFDAAVSGYLLRNVPDLDRTLAEQRRILKPGGRMAALDTTPPQRNLLRPFLHFYLQVIIPFLGRLITGEAEAYRYLPDSTEGFVEAGRLAERIRAAGFAGVGFVRRMFGTMAIHWGKKEE